MAECTYVCTYGALSWVVGSIKNVYGNNPTYLPEVSEQEVYRVLSGGGEAFPQKILNCNANYCKEGPT